jgi:hypothetical protein
VRTEYEVIKKRIEDDGSEVYKTAQVLSHLTRDLEVFHESMKKNCKAKKWPQLQQSFKKLKILRELDMKVAKSMAIMKLLKHLRKTRIGEKILVFSHSVKYLKQLFKDLKAATSAVGSRVEYAPKLLIGEMLLRDRNAVVKAIS